MEDTQVTITHLEQQVIELDKNIKQLEEAKNMIRKVLVELKEK